MHNVCENTLLLEELYIITALLENNLAFIYKRLEESSHPLTY